MGRRGELVDAPREGIPEGTALELGTGTPGFTRERKVFREDSLIAENRLCKGTGVWTRATVGTGRDMCTEQKRRKGPQRELGWDAKGEMPGS